VPALLESHDAVAAFCDQVFVDTRSGTRRHRDLSIYAADTTRRMFLYGPPTPSCTVIRNDVFQKLGGYDQSLTCSEDYDLNLRLSLEGQWVHVPSPVVTMRRASGETNVSAHHLTEVSDPRIGIQRAMMLDRFARKLGGRKAMRRRTWRNALGRHWLSQGQTLQGQGEHGRAAWCFRRAVWLAPWLGRAWRGLFNTRLRATPSHPEATMYHDEAEV
jgi:hypothetical protein